MRLLGLFGRKAAPVTKKPKKYGTGKKVYYIYYLLLCSNKIIHKLRRLRTDREAKRQNLESSQIM